jgi:hypothetical protein
LLTPAVAPGLERPEERVHHQPEASTETTHPPFGIPIVTSSVLLHHRRASPATEIQVVDVMGFWGDMRVAFKVGWTPGDARLLRFVMVTVSLLRGAGMYTLPVED